MRPPGPASDGPQQPWGPRLTAKDRMTLARLSGALDLWCVGELRDRPEEQRRQVLHGYGGSPQVWGVLLGSALRRVEMGEPSAGRAVEFCRRAGADEDAAATHLVWLRAQPGL